MATTNLNEVKLNDIMTYDEVGELADANLVDIEEIGEEIIGENFLLLKGKDKVIMFVLDGVRGGEFCYKIIHIT